MKSSRSNVTSNRRAPLVLQLLACKERVFKDFSSSRTRLVVKVPHYIQYASLVTHTHINIYITRNDQVESTQSCLKVESIESIAPTWEALFKILPACHSHAFTGSPVSGWKHGDDGYWPSLLFTRSANEGIGSWSLSHWHVVYEDSPPF